MKNSVSKQGLSEQVLQELVAAGQVTDPDSPRGRLLECAARLFREKGYSRTTVRDIAAEVGILSGSIFHHFKNKDEILYAVMHEVVLYMNSCLQQAVAQAGAEPRDRLRALIRTELAFIHAIRPDASAVLVYEWRALSAERQAEILAIRQAYEELWLAEIGQAQRDGLTAVEPSVLRQLLHGAISWSTYWYKPSGELSLEQLVERVLLLALTP